MIHPDAREILIPLRYHRHIERLADLLDRPVERITLQSGRNVAVVSQNEANLLDKRTAR